MRIIISGGGTGGHIYPALALIQEVKKQEPNSEILYVGSTRGIEKNIIPKFGIKFKELKIQGFKRSLSFDNLKTVYLFLKSVHKSKKLVKQFHPDIVIGTGGYVSGAVVYAASRLHVPTLIHEQNSVVGLTNRFLSHYVNKIAIAFHMVEKQFPSNKVVFTGNPRAQQVANLKSNFDWNQYGLSNDIPTALIVGGSQGALKLNRSTINAINMFNKRKYQVVFVTGPKRYHDVKKSLHGVTINSNVVIKSYISDMPSILSKTDIIIGRAGATSLAEITAVGIPSILIPSPYVTADHQTKNAMSLVKNNAATIITEKDLNAATLVKEIDLLMNNNDKRKQMAINSKNMGVQDAATRLYKLVKKLANTNN